MAAAEALITGHIDLWTAAIKRKSGVGRGTSKKIELYGIKKLRALILEMAVRGLLVPQDPEDEPASVLLERIAAEKAQLIKEKKIKKPKVLPPITEEEIPFASPAGWEWVKLQEIGHDLGQEKPQNKFTYIDVGSINKNLGLIEEPAVLSASEAPSRARKLVTKGTVVYSTVRPYLLNVAVIDTEFKPKPIASTAFAVIHPLTGVIGRYIYRYLRSPTFITYVEGVQTGIAYPAINDKQFFNGLIPVPPTNEQHHIVAKVDELMALCDQLEQQTEANISAHQTLVGTLLAAITDPDSNINSAEAIDLLFANFDSLFTTEDSIDQLKQTILQLAVMGRLVPQDPNDEPASVLLKKIAAEKEKLVKEKKIKKQKALPPIGDEEKPFELPVGWGWAYIGDLIALKHGFAFKSKYFVTDPTPYILTTPGNFHEIGGFRDRGGKTKFYNGEVDPEFILHSGDLIIPMTEQAPGLLGSAAFIPDDGRTYIHNQRLGKLTPYNCSITPIFIALYFNAPYLRKQLATSCSGTTVRHTSPDKIFRVLFPVCSPAEQHRIVKKVDQLLTLCDQLKTQLTTTQTTQLHLADAVTEQAIA